MDRTNEQALQWLYYREDAVLDFLDLPPGGRIAVHSSRSPEKETDNEDSAAIVRTSDGQTVLAVADGVGGQPAGKHASALAIDEIRTSVLASEGDGESLRESVLSGFDRANRSVLELGNGAATTLAVVAIEDGIVRSYHVGDSGVLIVGGRGKLKLQTISHSPVGYALEAGVLDEQDAIEHEDRHLISNVIGDPTMHVVMSSPVRLRPLDTLIIATDGLFDNLYTNEIVDQLRCGPLDQCFTALIGECSARMSQDSGAGPSKPDDLTVLVYRDRQKAPSRIKRNR